MKRSFTDQIGHTITIESPPQRIISLVPSQTELLAYLGLDKEVAGITKFCIHPDEWFRTKTRVGGTKNVNFDKIEAINPDLIICNKEENTESEVKALMEKYPVWTSDIHNLDDAMNMINSIGEIVNKADETQKLTRKIKYNFEKLSLNKPKPLKVVYLIWKNPFMAAGKDTFIDFMLSQCNFINVCDASLGRYPELTIEGLRKLNPQLILLSSEPFPFAEKHIAEFKSYFPDSLPVLVDGEYFSWYGSRLLNAPEYLKSIMEKCIKV
ncbi:MAG TPA: helical backbone metal receptor [Bacteroidia bacterium]|nr:helical backbone metal receptor [Bacteroidia bacterium]